MRLGCLHYNHRKLHWWTLNICCCVLCFRTLISGCLCRLISDYLKATWRSLPWTVHRLTNQWAAGYGELHWSVSLVFWLFMNRSELYFAMMWLVCFFKCVVQAWGTILKWLTQTIILVTSTKIARTKHQSEPCQRGYKSPVGDKWCV